MCRFNEGMVNNITSNIFKYQHALKEKKKWQVGWEEMSGVARALLRALRLWLVPGEYQLLVVEKMVGFYCGSCSEHFISQGHLWITMNI